jgi:hypothetical protein
MRRLRSINQTGTNWNEPFCLEMSNLIFLGIFGERAKLLRASIHASMAERFATFVAHEDKATMDAGQDR